MQFAMCQMLTISSLGQRTMYLSGLHVRVVAWRIEACAGNVRHKNGTLYSRILL